MRGRYPVCVELAGDSAHALAGDPFGPDALDDVRADDPRAAGCGQVGARPCRTASLGD
jgi:hypothetical protein